MRWSIGTMAVVVLAAQGVLAAGWLAPPAKAQQVIQEAPLPSVDPPQMAQSPHTHLRTEDCVALPTPEQQTDCLNQVATQGDYLPTPAPAPNSDMPMQYRLQLGTRPVTPPQ
jgi:hypothetical protein